MPLHVTLRSELNAAIKAHPDTFAAICERAGYSISYARRVLTGEQRNPTLMFVECMATALRKNPLDLLVESE